MYNTQDKTHTPSGGFPSWFSRQRGECNRRAMTRPWKRLDEIFPKPHCSLVHPPSRAFWALKFIYPRGCLKCYLSSTCNAVFGTGILHPRLQTPLDYVYVGQRTCVKPSSTLPLLPALCLPRTLSRQATLHRRVIHGGLLLNTLPWTFIGVVLSLNVFSAAVLAALVPVVGACLLGLSLAKLWMELAVSPADLKHFVVQYLLEV